MGAILYHLKNNDLAQSLEKVVLLDFKIPFLTERYAYFHGLAIDRISKNGKLYVYG